MEEIINRVIEIDVKARAFIRRAEDRKASADKYIEEQRAALKAEAEKSLANELGKEQSKMNRKLEAKKIEISASEKAEMGKLDDFYKENGERLAEEIFREIIKSK